MISIFPGMMGYCKRRRYVSASLFPVMVLLKGALMQPFYILFLNVLLFDCKSFVSNGVKRDHPLELEEREREREREGSILKFE